MTPLPSFVPLALGDFIVAMSSLWRIYLVSLLYENNKPFMNGVNSNV